MRTLTISDPALLAADQFSLNPPIAAGASAIWWATDIGLSNGASVDSWAPRVGSATLSQTSTRRPTFQTSGIGGRPAVQFDGTDDILEATGTAPFIMNAGTGTVVIVGQGSNSGTEGWWWSSARNDAGVTLDRYYLGGPMNAGGGTPYQRMQANIGDVSASIAYCTPTTSATTWEWTVDSGPATWKIYKQNVNQTPLSGTAKTMWFDDVTNRTTFALGGLLYWGNVRVGFLNGKIAFCAVYDTPLSGDDRTRLYRWINRYYGL